MRAIAEPFFERSPYLLGPVFTLLLFFVVFVGVLVYVMRSKRLKFDEVSTLPLEGTLPLEDEASTPYPQSTSRASKAS